MYAVIMQPKKECDRDDYDIRRAAEDAAREIAKKEHESREKPRD